MTSPTLDCLNQHRAPRLEDLILAEVFLAGGPCYIHRLWAEMFERQKSISAGRIIFTREVIRMERDGLLQQHEGDRTAITNQGKVHLFGLVLLGMIPDEQKRRLESKGVLGVALQGREENTNGSIRSDVSPSGLPQRPESLCLRNQRDIGNQKGVQEVQGCGDEDNLLHISGQEDCILGVASVSPAPASGLSCVGSNGGGASPFLSSPPFPSDERFADNISRALDAYEMAEQLRAEEIEAEREGLMTEMSGYPQPGRWA